MKHLNNVETAGGLVLVFTGLAFAVASVPLGLGTSRSMGPGYLPFWGGLLTCGMGLINILFGIGRTHRINITDLRAATLVVLSFVVFCVAVYFAGLEPAVFLSVVVSSMAHQKFKMVNSLILGVLATVFLVLVFIVLLRLPLQTVLAY